MAELWYKTSTHNFLFENYPSLNIKQINPKSISQSSL